MAIWMEIRCEDAGEREGCYSNRNHGPMLLAADKTKPVLAGLSDLRKEAFEQGWKRTRDGYVCPACWEVRS